MLSRELKEYPRFGVQAILGLLANGKNPFAMLAFRLRKHQTVMDQIRINGTKPEMVDDWRHVSSYIALKSDFDGFFWQWNSLCGSLQIASPGMGAQRRTSFVKSASLIRLARRARGVIGLT